MSKKEELLELLLTQGSFSANAPSELTEKYFGEFLTITLKNKHFVVCMNKSQAYLWSMFGKIFACSIPPESLLIIDTSDLIDNLFRDALTKGIQADEEEAEKRASNIILSLKE